jgi:hypothetical protein
MVRGESPLGGVVSADCAAAEHIPASKADATLTQTQRIDCSPLRLAQHVRQTTRKSYFSENPESKSNPLAQCDEGSNKLPFSAKIMAVKQGCHAGFYIRSALKAG